MHSIASAPLHQTGAVDDPLIDIDQILYCSLVKGTMSPAQLEALIATSARLNRLDGITGVLMFDGRAFVQLIEGPPESVNNLWRRLLHDGRHFAIVQLYHLRELEARTCSGWSMRHVDRRDLKAIVHSARLESEVGDKPTWAKAVERMDHFLTQSDDEDMKNSHDS